MECSKNEKHPAVVLVRLVKFVVQPSTKMARLRTARTLWPKANRDVTCEGRLEQCQCLTQRQHETIPGRLMETRMH
jgi:hypothetical protein